MNTLTLQIATALLITSSISAAAQSVSTPPAGRFIESECDNSQRINVRFALNSATVLYRGQLVTLRQQPSGSGYRYADANWVLSGKGTTSTLETAGGAKLAVNCEGGAVATGTVTYLPKIALPATAVVTVRLEEVSRADAPSTLLATVNVPVQGQQVPISWGFVYDPNWLEPNGRYVVRAEITDGGRLIWTSDTALSLPQGGSNQLEINVVQVSQTPAPSVNLRGTNWELTSLTVSGVQTRVTTKPRPTLSFDGSRMSGNSGCNGFGGSYTQNANRLQIGTVISTLKACADDSMMKLEAMYFRALSGTVQISSDSSGLTMTYANGDVLVFTRAATSQLALPLPGSSWELMTLTIGGVQTRVTAEPRPTLYFDGSGLRINGGCNPAGGPYTLTGNQLKIGTFIITNKACSASVMNLEVPLYTTMRGTVQVGGDSSRLTLTAANGDVLVFARLPDGATAQSPLAPSGSSWKLSSYLITGSRIVTVDANPPTVVFDKAGRVTGFSGCNRFAGGFSSSSAGALKFTSVRGLQRGCGSAISALETAFLKILQGATRYSSDGNKLTITSSAGILTFTRSN